MTEKEVGKNEGNFDLGRTDYNGFIKFEYQPDIVTNRDRLHRLFTKNIRYVNIGIEEWGVPLTFVITLFLSLVTSKPIDRWGIDATTWCWIILFLFVISFFWFVMTLIILIRKSMSIDKMIDIIEDNQTGEVVRE